MPMIATTIINSIRVKPCCFFMVLTPITLLELLAQSCPREGKPSGWISLSNFRANCWTSPSLAHHWPLARKFPALDHGWQVSQPDDFCHIPTVCVFDG